jgi:prepilin signal peptidase PulO-like enzyme (type II secretory pathway)
MWIADYTIISVLIINIIRTILNFYYNHEIKYDGTIFLVLFILIVLLSQLILKKELMGFGDLKLFFVLSFNYSFINTITLLMFSALIGIIYYYIFNKKNEFPFGPAIIIAYIAIEILKS